MPARNRRWKRIAAQWFSLPPDTFTDISRVTCLHGEQVIVENIKGLLRVSEQLVEMDVGHAVLAVTGRDFVVTLASHTEVQLEGKVESLTYRSKGVTR